jgi:hypothetical protein
MRISKRHWSDCGLCLRQGPFLTQRESLVRLIARAAQADCGRDTALNRLAVGSYEWDAYERTSFGPQLSIR